MELIDSAYVVSGFLPREFSQWFYYISSLSLPIFILWNNTYGPKKKKESNPKIKLEYSYETFKDSAEFNGVEIFVGRDLHADISVPLDTVSNLHARLFRKKNNGGLKICSPPMARYSIMYHWYPINPGSRQSYHVWRTRY